MQLTAAAVTPPAEHIVRRFAGEVGSTAAGADVSRIAPGIEKDDGSRQGESLECHFGKKGEY
jgi:hypothetical protein